MEEALPVLMPAISPLAIRLPVTTRPLTKSTLTAQFLKLRLLIVGQNALDLQAMLVAQLGQTRLFTSY